MNSSNKHIIEKVRFRINTASLEEAHHLKETISDVIHSRFVPFLEKYFEELFTGWNEQTIRIEQLKISLDINNLLQEFPEVTVAFKKEMDLVMHDVMNSATGDFQPDSSGYAEKTKHSIVLPEQRKSEALFDFLKTGRTPWWTSPEQLDELLDEEKLIVFLNTAKSTWQEFVRLIKTDAVVRTRFASQFSSSFVLGVLLKISGTHSELQLTDRSFFNTFYNDLNGRKREQFIALILEMVSNTGDTLSRKKEWQNRLLEFLTVIHTAFELTQKEENFVIDFNQILAAILQTHELEIMPGTVMENILANKDHSSIESGVQRIDESRVETEDDLTLHEAEKIIRKEEDAEVLEKGLFIENGGLIILHPFLPHFFQLIGLLDENKQLNDPDLAVQVLHYLATGLENDWEHNLVFEKFLCGIPLNEPVRKLGSLSLEIKAESEELFKSLLEHWSVLKNSSVELIRYEFLTRNGKLFRDDASARLIIERKTQDILLDKLPWGISIVKFPWSTNILYSTW